MKVVIEETWRKRLLQIKVMSVSSSSVIHRAVLRLAERRKHQEQEKSLESFGCLLIVRGPAESVLWKASITLRIASAAMSMEYSDTWNPVDTCWQL